MRSETRFGVFVERLIDAVGDEERTRLLRAYCTGLLLPRERKCVEPMAARLKSDRLGAAHQALCHFVAKAP